MMHSAATGYSALVEANGQRILFDTGNNGEVLRANARAKGVDLTKLDFVVLSHRHSDHMGGLAYLLKINPKVRIYAPSEPFGVYGFELPATFPRPDQSLDKSERYFDGNRVGTWKMGTAWPGANFKLVDKTTQIMPGVHLISLVSDKPGTLELKELSLAIETPNGIVLVVGCSHPGIGNVVKEAAAINPHIYAVAGGMHMLVAKDPDIQAAVAALHDTFRVEYVAPGHCTGEVMFAALKKAFGSRYLYAGVGTRLKFGPGVTAENKASLPQVAAAAMPLLSGLSNR